MPKMAPKQPDYIAQSKDEDELSSLALALRVTQGQQSKTSSTEGEELLALFMVSPMAQWTEL